MIRKHLDDRLLDVGLELHREKTRVVYCKDSNRTRTYEHIKFDFLGYTFRPRQSTGRDGRPFSSFTPAVSRSSLTTMRRSTRSRRLHLNSEWGLDDLARVFNPSVRGWMGYYCRFRGSEFYPVAKHIDIVIVRWAMRKYKRLRYRKVWAIDWLDSVKRKRPALYVHWCGCGEFTVGTMGAR